MVSGSLQLDFEMLPNIFLPTMSGSGYAHHWLQCHSVISDKWLLVLLAGWYKGTGSATGGPGQVPAKLWGIRSGSVKICPLIIFLTDCLFAAAWRSTQDPTATGVGLCRYM